MEEIVKSFVSLLYLVVVVLVGKGKSKWVLIRQFHAYMFIDQWKWLHIQESEASKEGNAWNGAVLKGLKISSPTGLKNNTKIGNDFY